jgi:hypothetical protein
MSDLAVRGRVLGKIRVQQDDRGAAAQVTLDDVEPGADPDGPVFDPDSYFGVQPPRPILRLPDRRMFELVAGSVDLLPKVPAAADESYRNQR